MFQQLPHFVRSPKRDSEYLSLSGRPKTTGIPRSRRGLFYLLKVLSPSCIIQPAGVPFCLILVTLGSFEVRSIVVNTYLPDNVRLREEIRGPYMKKVLQRMVVSLRPVFDIYVIFHLYFHLSLYSNLFPFCHLTSLSPNLHDHSLLPTLKLPHPCDPEYLGRHTLVF